jgi:hypothetical protein
MSPLLVPALFAAFFLAGSLCWGMRGAIICFLLPPVTAFVIGIYIIVHHDQFVWLGSWRAQILHLVARAFGGPYLFVVIIWMIGFPAAALGLWLRGRIKSSKISVVKDFN